MRLEDLAREYDRSAALLRERISALEQEWKQANDNRRIQLEGRLRPLRGMYRDTRRIARYLTDYYGKKGGSCDENRVL